MRFPHPHCPGWREHRTVFLPEFQGVGIGMALSEHIAACFCATRKHYFSTTSHPALIRHRLRSPLWKCLRLPSLGERDIKHNLQGTAASAAVNRLTSSFEYVGPANAEGARLQVLL